MTSVSFEPASPVQGSVPSRRFYPFEQIQCDQTLDGSRGGTRVHLEEYPCPVDRDIDAAERWLATFERPNTRRQARKVMDALFNWAVFSRRLPVSSFTVEDFALFDRYLAEPSLWDPPGTKSAPARRGDPDWRPIRHPLGVSSRRTMMYMVRSLANWMKEAHYAYLDVDSKRRGLGFRPAFSSSVVSGFDAASPERISFEAWTVLSQSMATWPTSLPWLRTRMTIDLLYRADLTLEEVTSLDYPCLTGLVDGTELPVIQVPYRTGERARVYLVPEVKASLSAWLRGAIAHCGAATDVKFVSRMQSDTAFGNAKQLAAEYARARGWLGVANELDKMTPKLLHRALATHAYRLGWGTKVWHLLGSTMASKSAFDTWIPRELLSAQAYDEMCRSLRRCQEESEVRAVKRLVQAAALAT